MQCYLVRIFYILFCKPLIYNLLSIYQINLLSIYLYAGQQDLNKKGQIAKEKSLNYKVQRKKQNLGHTV